MLRLRLREKAKAGRHFARNDGLRRLRRPASRSRGRNRLSEADGYCQRPHPDKKNAILTRIPVGLLAVLVLVAANGFFVAAEFSLVAIRKSQVAELVAAGRMNAAALQRAIGSLDANLAATQLGITISSLSLGWIGEPALAGLVEPLVNSLPESLALAASHTIAVAIAFTIITSLHIVLGELAPKSLALQRTEATALWVARPLRLFLFSALASHFRAERPWESRVAAGGITPWRNRDIAAFRRRTQASRC
jgi:hypothetical protein